MNKMPIATLIALLAVPSIAAAANDPGTALPLYPGAKISVPQTTVTKAGHTTNFTGYELEHKVTFGAAVAWYRRALSGSASIPCNSSNSTLSKQAAWFLESGGSTTVAVALQTFKGGATAEMLNAENGVVLTFIRHSPPTSAAEIVRGCKVAAAI